MATYTYDRSYWKTFEQGNSIEWVLTAGNGAYAGGSLIGGRNRTHQGYLIASYDPPTGRTVILDQITEYVVIGDAEFDLEASQYPGGEHSEGYRYLKKVNYDGTVCFEYELNPLTECESGMGMMSMTKQIALVRGSNTVAVSYIFSNFTADPAEVILTPKFNHREHNTLTDSGDLGFSVLLTGDTLSLVPDSKPNTRIDFSVSEGRFIENTPKYDRTIELQTEVDLETEGRCTSFIPYDIGITVPAGGKKHLSVVCTLTESDSLKGEDLLEAASDRFVAAGTARKLIEGVKDYYLSLYHPKGDVFFDRLVMAADCFIADRKSTGLKTVLAGLPWFTDWGRDTMIAFTGLTLCTGRYEDARQILKSFALYEKDGLIPNMFPDNGAAPLYNTADASLWYFIAVYEYIRYAEKGFSGKADTERSEDFIRTEIYPTLIRILDAYEHGTANSIYMEPSGLIHAGSGLDQVTWMDVRVGDMVVTPRHGCPVEINALWYNALCIGASLAEEFSDMGRACHWKELADRVESIFESVYLADGYLYDVVDACIEDPDHDGSFIYEKCDESIRPNQIYAVSLPFSPLSGKTACMVVDTVERHLYTGCAIRSLDPENPDYHGRYRGALEKRDLSYHQGTGWGFLLGAFISAYRKVHTGEPGLKTRIAEFFEPVKHHLSEENCIGGFCEVFEGDAPNRGCGCYTQAWSIGEILRAYVEDYVMIQ